MSATFEQVRDILNTIADTQDPNARDQVYGRHDAQGRFSWDTQEDLIAAIADPRGTPTRLLTRHDYRNMPPETIKKECKMLSMLIGNPPAMPRLREGTNRRPATPAEIDIIVSWVKTLDLSGMEP
ncbi:MAG TPA: hypothetical protein VF472_09120 [Burkholderiaceae bacterium]